MENISTNNMYEHVKSIKNSCDKYRKENGGSCRGCIFNKLVYKDGDYDDFEWTDENDKNDDNLTFCELFFDIGPLNWDLEEFSNKIDEHKKLLEVLLHHKGPVVVSSYTNKLYDEWLVLENGWDKKTIKVQANAGKSTLECIYLNRMCNIEISLF